MRRRYCFCRLQKLFTIDALGAAPGLTGSIGNGRRAALPIYADYCRIFASEGGDREATHSGIALG
ncbi:hypothetical protein PGN35_020105 [Nodosilinea sp. PGN35]|uniref:hypothetical protein n=1 Tax=Nodosilinea sp. PGN35 TaxID=3020489 RepID=UPI00398B9819